jgi:hypothetical protein
MATLIDPKQPQPHPRQEPPVEPGEPPQPTEYDHELVPDEDPFENPPAYEAPEPGEGP